MAGDDIKSQALDATQDYYALLGVSPGATTSEIRSAGRRTALKYHPDKVGPNNKEALEKFHLLQIALEILEDDNIRQLYDNARRAQEERSQRNAAYEGRRKEMKEELERAEKTGVKRKRDESVAEDEFQRELARLAADGRRRRERAEQLRREALELEAEEEQKRAQGTVAPPVTAMPNGVATGPSDEDRSITLRYPKTNQSNGITKDRLEELFSRFGPIEEAILRDKKVKVDGEKHRQVYVVAVLMFKSIVGAHAAMMDLPKLRTEDPETWAMFDQVNWASGKEPDCVPRPSVPLPGTGENVAPRAAAAPKPPTSNDNGLSAAKKAPSFGSFKGGAVGAQSTPSADEVLMMRLKNAEKRRLEEKIRREEAAAEANAQATADG